MVARLSHCRKECGAAFPALVHYTDTNTSIRCIVSVYYDLRVRHCFLSHTRLLCSGWNSFSNLLYVDQPAGTGFSYVSNPLGYVTNERTIGTELWSMLLQFYAKYPKYSNLDLYIVGESYGKTLLAGHVVLCSIVLIYAVSLHTHMHTHTAGHYVPATAQVILESNSIYVKNLKGIGIGNGWVDPYVQYAAYGEVCIVTVVIIIHQPIQIYFCICVLAPPTCICVLAPPSYTHMFNDMQFALKEKLINSTTAKIANVMYDACKCEYNYVSSSG